MVPMKIWQILKAMFLNFDYYLETYGNVLASFRE